MIKNKPRRAARLLVSLIVGLAAAGAIGVAIAKRSNGSGTAGQMTVPPPMSTTTPQATTGPGVPSTSGPGRAPAAAASLTDQPRPLGIGGKWRLVFNDGFSGDALNLHNWNAHNGWADQNAVTDSIGNVRVRNGDAILELASQSSGAELGTRSFALKVGEFAEARIRFAGKGRTIYNWPAWWLSGPNWPNGGESDIAEGFGELTANYHSPSATIHSGPVPGAWANHFHIFGIYRSRYYARIYWDGKVIGAYNTHDDGAPETLLLTLGAGNEIRTGLAGAMRVDYVRAWAPVGGHRLR